MLSIKAFNGEKIDRGPIWYIVFFTIVIFLIIYSFSKGGLMGGISILFLFAVVIVAYIIIYLMSIKTVTINLYEGFFVIGDKKYNFDDLMGFNIELNDKGNFTNFVIVPRNTGYPLKYKIISSFEEVEKFYKSLISMGLALYGDYENERMYKIIKFLKLG